MAPSIESKVIFSRDDLTQPYNQHEIDALVKRKGIGGGGGRSSSSGGRSSSSSGSSSSSSGSSGSSGSRSSSSSSGASKGFTPGSVSGGRSVYGSSSGTGIPNRYTVTSGSFAGRQAGGGTRSSVYGSSYYGSGYTSGYANRGFYSGGPVRGFGFPFIFWPLAFSGGYAGYYGSRELNDDSNRPGGAMTQYSLAPPSTVTNTTANEFALYGDANSVDTVFRQLTSTCGVMTTLASNFTLNPNQAVQYYRGSSFALMLNGYNNTQPLNTTDADGNTTSLDISATAPPITSVAGVDQSYFTCLNTTIGTSVPLLNETDGALSLLSSTNLALLVPVLLFSMLMNLFS